MEKGRYAIIKIGQGNFILPYRNLDRIANSPVTGITLEDDTKITIGTNNLITIFGDFDIMNAIIESSNEPFYKVQKDEQGKIKMKKIGNDN